MSPGLTVGARWGRRFPRVSGDEPRGGSVIQVLTLFSPRERG